jgi:hypothetical protein
VFSPTYAAATRASIRDVSEWYEEQEEELSPDTVVTFSPHPALTGGIGLSPSRAT